jgi:hypothetical protein
MSPKSKKKNKTKKHHEESLSQVRDEIARNASIMKRLEKTLKKISK